MTPSLPFPYLIHKPLPTPPAAISKSNYLFGILGRSWAQNVKESRYPVVQAYIMAYKFGPKEGMLVPTRPKMGHQTWMWTSPSLDKVEIMSECGHLTRNSFFRNFINNNNYYYNYYLVFGPPPNPIPHLPISLPPSPPTKDTHTNTPLTLQIQTNQAWRNEVMRRAKMVPTYYHADDGK